VSHDRAKQTRVAIALVAVLAGAWIVAGAAKAEMPSVPQTKEGKAVRSAEQVKARVEQQQKKAVGASQGAADQLSGGTPAPETAAAPAPATKTAAAPKKPAPAPAPVTNTPRKSEERHLVNREVYVYKTVGRRDPFASLLEGEFETTVGQPLLDVSSMKLVGIVWSPSDKFALVEDGRGHGHVLRVGDPVINGSVVGLTRSELMIRQQSYGDSQTVTIQLQRKEGQSDE
jgi:hypothetical protein